MKKAKNISVDEFMQILDHPFKKEVEKLRKIILDVDPRITEQIKWNCPSFCYNNDDRITFRLHPPKFIQLIFHRGAKVRADVEEFSFDDPTNLTKWITKDRGTITLKNMDEIKSKTNDLRLVVDKWMKATAD